MLIPEGSPSGPNDALKAVHTHPLPPSYTLIRSSPPTPRFSEWPNDALEAVALKFLKDLDVEAKQRTQVWGRVEGVGGRWGAPRGEGHYSILSPLCLRRSTLVFTHPLRRHYNTLVSTRACALMD